MKPAAVLSTTALLITLACAGMTSITTPTAVLSRTDSIPANAHKITPAEDSWPPVVAKGLSKPQPLPYPVNTAGAEDSPFLTLDGQTLYFFFTPDLNIPAQKQLFDGVTGIWMSQRVGTSWDEPQRVHLEKAGDLALDGCEFVLNEWMVFCSVRTGNFRDVDLYTATKKNGIWTDVKNWGKQMNVDYEVGELHITSDGQTLIFGSKRAGGLGGYDLWVSTKTNNGWSEPINLGTPVNTPADENRPYLSPDGQTLWYDGVSKKGLPGPAIFRSFRQADGTWSQPEEMVSQFAGEPALSADGHTLYFVHHYFSADMKKMIEADIYVTAVQ